MNLITNTQNEKTWKELRVCWEKEKEDPLVFLLCLSICHLSIIYLLSIYLLTHLSSISRFIIGLWPLDLQGLVNQSWGAVSSVSGPWGLRADSQKGKMDMERGNQGQLEAGRMRGAPMTDWNLYGLSLPRSLYLLWWECPTGEGHTLCYEAKHTLTMKLEKLKKDLEGVGISLGP